MALLAEEFVEEWLNRQGYFTIRGSRVAKGELDLLAVSLSTGVVPKARHVEVQVSFNPVGYVSPVPKIFETKTYKGNSAKLRSPECLKEGAREYVQRKFFADEKKELRRMLYDGAWSCELVAHKVKDETELKLMSGFGAGIIRFSDVLRDLRGRPSLIRSCSRNDLVEAIRIYGTL